jgi:hypothetical protein
MRVENMGTRANGRAVTVLNFRRLECMDVYLHAHFILHGVVHNVDAVLIFTRHYCHVVSQKFRVREV